MNVLMFGWEYPPHITGGLGTACHGLTRGLADKGVNIRFVVPKAFGNEDQRYVKIHEANGVPVSARNFNAVKSWKDITYIEVGSMIVPYTSPEYFRKLAEKRNEKQPEGEDDKYEARFSGAYTTDIFEEVQDYARVASFLASRYAHDIIHVHDWLTFPAGVAAQKASGKPLVVHVHATEFDRSGEHINKQVFAIEQMGMRNADCVITVSNFTRERVIHRYGIAAEKVHTVYNGADAGLLKHRASVTKGVDEKIVTFLGRITYQKGPEYFVEAARLMLNHYTDVRFVMAGTGDLWHKMVKRAAELHIADKFHFTGYLNGRDVDQLFALTDVFVMPSVSEPFGIVPLEAMHSGVPVIVSRQSGVAEILKHAIKIDFWDLHALADAIYGLLEYKGIRAMFKTHGKTEVEELKWEHAAWKVKGLYQSQKC